MNGRQLRDLRTNTELILLAEILRRPSARLKELSGTLGITVQAVSQYLSAMRKEGLIGESRGQMRPTRKGMQLLQEHFTTLKGEVDGVLRSISVIDRCVAIAGKKVAKGDKVGLVMEDGMLMAYPRQKASSTGEALEAADEGDDVLVGKLEGIADLELGKLLVVEAPPESEGGSKAADVERVKQRIEDFAPGLLVAGDMTGAALLMKTSGEFFSIHAPVESAMSALSKGVDVVFCGTHETIDGIIQAVTELKRSTGYDIVWKSYRA